MIIPEDLPLDLAPLAWMLGRWEGWGMMTPDSEDADAPDVPAIEDITCAILGTQMRMVTRVHAAALVDEFAQDGPDPVWDAARGLAAMRRGEVLWEETAYLRVLPSTGELPPPGEYLPREITGTSATTTGLGALWAGVAVGPRVQLVSDAVARAAHALPVEHMGRMYGLVAGELLWTQERALAGREASVELTGRLRRAGEDSGE